MLTKTCAKRFHSGTMHERPRGEDFKIETLTLRTTEVADTTHTAWTPEDLSNVRITYNTISAIFMLLAYN